METWDAIRSRRNVRTYTDAPISGQHLNRILEAGWRSPSGMNLQPWDFVVCTEREQLADLARVWQGAGHVARSAATIAVVSSRPGAGGSEGMLQYDLGQATMNMMLAATDLGIGTAHAAVRDQALAQEVLGFPDDRFCAWMIALGYPADRPLTPIVHPNRRPFDTVVHHATW